MATKKKTKKQTKTKAYSEYFKSALQGAIQGFSSDSNFGSSDEDVVHAAGVAVRIAEKAAAIAVARGN